MKACVLSVRGLTRSGAVCHPTRSSICRCQPPSHLPLTPSGLARRSSVLPSRNARAHAPGRAPQPLCEAGCAVRPSHGRTWGAVSNWLPELCGGGGGALVQQRRGGPIPVFCAASRLGRRGCSLGWVRAGGFIASLAHGLHQSLEVERGCSGGRLAEAFSTSIDFLVLELDDPSTVVRAAQECRRCSLGLAVARARSCHRPASRVSAYDQVVFSLRPWPVRHCARLWASEDLFVIRDFARRVFAVSPAYAPRKAGVAARAVLLTALRVS